MASKVRSPQKYSMSHKLSSLAVGETIYIPDDFIGLGVSDATVKQRTCHVAPKRSQALAGKKFTTKRCSVVSSDLESSHVLMVKRIK